VTVLSNLPAKDIASTVADAAERWRDADFPARVRATARVAERTGYSVPVVEYGLDRLFSAITPDALAATIANELGGFEILDGFRPRAGRTDAWAAPTGSVCVISSRTTIGVALPAAVFALCAKCDVLVKDREDSLISAFFETLHEECEEFRSAARAELWNSSEDAAPDLDSFDAVVAFGKTGTLATIRAALRPEARFIAFGSRASAGYISREALSAVAAAKDIGAGAARDIVLYETEGCLSLHVLFVEDGGAVNAAEFTALLEKEIAILNVEFPRAAAAVRRADVAHGRALAAFRQATAGTSLLDAPPPFLPRLPNVIAVSDPAEALRYIRLHGLLLEGFAIAGNRPDIMKLAVEAGAVRLSGFGKLQDPPLYGNHGGRPRIGEFVKWIDRTP
jgi:hypothetical protein